AQTAGVETMGGDAPRVQVANRRGPWQEVAILGFRLAELDTPAFRKFLAEAVVSFQANLKRMSTKPEDVMPWKVNGERWHLSDKGFPPGRRIQWDRSVLARLLDVVKAVEPQAEIAWDNRAFVSVRVPKVSRAWAQWKTKDA